jgi:hypothetical protein
LEKKIELGCLHVEFDDIGRLTIADIRGSSQLTLLCSDNELSEKVDVYGGVMSKFKALVSIGNFIEYSDNEGSVASVSALQVLNPESRMVGQSGLNLPGHCQRPQTLFTRLPHVTEQLGTAIELSKILLGHDD